MYIKHNSHINSYSDHLLLEDKPAHKLDNFYSYNIQCTPRPLDAPAPALNTYHRMGEGEGKKAYNTSGGTGGGHFLDNLLSRLSLHRFY